MTNNQYECRCGVCGREHIVHAEFLSVGFSYADGRLRVNCRGEFKHSPAEVRAAWESHTAA